MTGNQKIPALHQWESHVEREDRKELEGIGPVSEDETTTAE